MYCPPLDNYKQGAFTMLLQNFYNNVVDFINDNKQQLFDYATKLKQAGGYNNFDLRLAFDVFYYQQAKSKLQAGNVDFDFLQDVATICNIDDKNKILDNHIATLYKKALKDCGLL